VAVTWRTLAHIGPYCIHFVQSLITPGAESGAVAVWLTKVLAPVRPAHASGWIFSRLLLSTSLMVPRAGPLDGALGTRPIPLVGAVRSASLESAVDSGVVAGSAVGVLVVVWSGSGFGVLSSGPGNRRPAAASSAAAAAVSMVCGTASSPPGPSASGMTAAAAPIAGPTRAPVAAGRRSRCTTMPCAGEAWPRGGPGDQHIGGRPAGSMVRFELLEAHRPRLEAKRLVRHPIVLRLEIHER